MRFRQAVPPGIHPQSRGVFVSPGIAPQPARQNPLRRGWSRQVVATNIREMMHAGHPQPQAIAASLSSARRSFRGAHPRAALPPHLALRGLGADDTGYKQLGLTVGLAAAGTAAAYYLLGREPLPGALLGGILGLAFYAYGGAA